MHELQEDAKETVEEYTSQADKRASSPGAGCLLRHAVFDLIDFRRFL